METQLAEILIKPSNEIVTERFNTQEDENAMCKASCSGKCTGYSG